MNITKYRSDITKDNSCSYFFFSNDEENTENKQNQSRRELKESLSKSFKDIATYWCYVLITDDLRRLVNPAVINKETNEAFNGPETIWLNGIGLIRAFFSTAPVLHSESSGNNIQLVEHYNASSDEYTVVIPALPGPEYNHIAPLNTISEFIGQKFSFIYL